MPVVNRIADYAAEMTAWRRHLHQHPELGFDCPETAAFIAARLREFGVDELHEGIARTGIVALIEGQGPGPTIGLRADFDALPIAETTGLDYASQTPGRMHACGHDGHTAMLLGAAKYLAETRNFAGRVALIFQPAEEDGGGGEVMVQEGALDRFDIGQVYALHNAPGFTAGGFYTTPGPLMAAVDQFHIHIKGVGGHGAMPHETRDPVVAALSIGQALQTIVSRNNYALDDLVISLTQIHTGTTDNVIPEAAYLNGTVRTFDPRVQQMVIERMEAIVAGQAMSFEVEARLDYEKGYPATINDADKTRFAVEVAEEIAGADNVLGDVGREMGAEDFAFMLQERPGAYLFIGQGETAGLHQPDYNFNDEIAPAGASFFARLVERAQPVAK
ncbi:M20 aminoacylase family protein [Pseudodonghicola flavimaris]|uniref:M20 aminoacylase family protein n=1 Tax=Pseudodonghicola flavimaris TaxID=3050036 RepID=A0ABT7EVJ5_9RHOB|nr:M20 aminoacylase family protein [Pseudodonghicola flavimaris]MDK3016375.1 M20 aminoacylase family protein [Pseudodonghicola flavimaris]